MTKVHLPKLIITVFIISWIGILPSLLISYGVAIPQGLQALQILMTLGPILGAIVFIYRTHGKQGLKDFFSRLFFFKAKPVVILVAVIAPILVSFLAPTIGFQLLGEAWPERFTPEFILTEGLMIFVMYLIFNTEELAWRGLVFDQLFSKHGYLKACLILAPIWWLFHMPMFLRNGGHEAGYGLIEFTFIVLAQTFTLGWIYIRSNRSLFYAHMHHQVINGFGQAFPIFPVFIGGLMVPVWMFCGLLVLVAIPLVINGHKRFNDTNQMQES